MPRSFCGVSWRSGGKDLVTPGRASRTVGRFMVNLDHQLLEFV